MRSALVGAVEATRVALTALADAGSPPQALVTLGPNEAERHSDFVDLRPTARRLGLKVIEARTGNEPGVIAQLRSLELDVVLVVGWSRIARAELRGVARHGAVGFHPSPLPRDRGRAVIAWSILNGYTMTGSTLFWLDDGIDSGPIIDQRLFDIAPAETARTLYDKHMAALSEMLRRLPASSAAGRVGRKPQDHAQATYCARRTARDGYIDWARPAQEIWTLVRATSRPYPGAYTFRRGRRLIIWHAELIGRGSYSGLPGQVQAVDEQGALVLCGDRGLVRLVDLEADGEPATTGASLRLHESLGLHPAELWAATGRV